MLEINNLTKRFNSIVALDNISITINEGEKIVIIGPSGCEKPTLLRCINLLEDPTNGQIFYKGKDTKEYDRIHLRQEIGMIFQNYNLFNHLTVRDNLILAPTKLKILTKEEALEKAKDLLESFKLSHKIDKYPHQLSGGEKQRIAIIRSLMLSPKILLVDEPTSALDPEMVHEVLDLMNEIANKGMTMIIVTHEMSFAKKFADRIAFMDKGKIVEIGTAEEIFNYPKSERLKEFLSQVKS